MHFTFDPYWQPECVVSPLPRQRTLFFPSPPPPSPASHPLHGSLFLPSYILAHLSGNTVKSPPPSPFQRNHLKPLLLVPHPLLTADASIHHSLYFIFSWSDPRAGSELILRPVAVTLSMRPLWQPLCAPSVHDLLAPWPLLGALPGVLVFLFARPIPSASELTPGSWSSP